LLLRVQARRISVVGVIRVYGTVVVKSVGGQGVGVHGSRDGIRSSRARLGWRVEQLGGVDRSISVHAVDDTIVDERIFVSNAQRAGTDEARGRLPGRDVMRHSGRGLDRAVSTWSHWAGGAVIRVVAVRAGRGDVSLGDTPLLELVFLGLGSESIVRGLGSVVFERWGSNHGRIRGILEMGRRSLCRRGRVEGVEVVEIVGGLILLHGGKITINWGSLKVTSTSKKK
jgi:hypothetical protein